MVADRRRSFLPFAKGVALADHGITSRQDGAQPMIQFDISACQDERRNPLAYIYDVDARNLRTVNTTESYTIADVKHGQVFLSKEECGDTGEKCIVVDYTLTPDALEVMILNDSPRKVVDPVTVSLNLSNDTIACINERCDDGTNSLNDASRALSSPPENAVITITYSCRNDSATSGDPSGSSLSSNDSPANSINVPALIGGVVGGTALLVLALLVFVWWRRKRYISRDKSNWNKSHVVPRSSMASRPPLPSKEYPRKLSVQTTSSSKSQEAFGGANTPISAEVQEFTPTSTTMLMPSNAPSAFRFPAQPSPGPFGPAPFPPSPGLNDEGTTNFANTRQRAQSFKRGRLSDRVVAVEERIRAHSLSRPPGQPLVFTANGGVAPEAIVPPLPASPPSGPSSPLEAGPMSLKQAYRAHRS